MAHQASRRLLPFALLSFFDDDWSSSFWPLRAFFLVAIDTCEINECLVLKGKLPGSFVYLQFAPENERSILSPLVSSLLYFDTVTGPIQAMDEVKDEGGSSTPEFQMEIGQFVDQVSQEPLSPMMMNDRKGEQDTVDFFSYLPHHHYNKWRQWTTFDKMLMYSLSFLYPSTNPWRSEPNHHSSSNSLIQGPLGNLMF